MVATSRERKHDPAEAVRPCPDCGENVAIDELDCPHCQFDFRTIA